MSVEVEKISVFDDRIIQPQPTYAVEKGALALTNVPFQAITNTTTQLTFNVIVPSENVFVDRAVDVSATIKGSCVVALNGLAAGVPLFPIGSVAPAPFPLQQICTSVQATINDATVVINTVDVLPQVLRFVDYKAHRLQRTCPTALDNYASYSDSINGTSIATNSPLGAYNNARNADEVGNGAYPGFSWLSALDGSPVVADIAGTDSATAPVAGYRNGWPCSPGTTVTTSGGATLFWQIFTTEKLVLSPFIFGDAYEYDTGLFGVQNIQLVMNINPNGVRILRHAYDARTSTATSPFLSQTVTSFVSPRLQVQFLTPSLDVSLPAKSVIPYTEFPRYITTLGETLSAVTRYTSTGGTGGGTANPALLAGAFSSPSVTTVQTNTITLPLIPDLLMVYVRPASYTRNPTTGAANSGSATTTLLTSNSSAIANYTIPIQGLSINFDNFAGLLSSHTQEQLYKMSVANGLEMDYATWTGFAQTGLYQAGTAVTTNTNFPSWIPTVGPILVLKPGRDIPLQAGQAPGLVGNFSLQMSLRIYNNSLVSYAANELQIYVVTVNSGFFETIKGSSRLIKGLLTEQDIISAPEADAMTSGQVARLVGSGAKVQNVLSKLKRRLSKMRERPAPAMGRRGRGEAPKHESMEGDRGRGMQQYYQ